MAAESMVTDATIREAYDQTSNWIKVKNMFRSGFGVIF